MEERKLEEDRLLAMLAAESQYAFQLLFDRYKDHVFRVALRYVRSPAIGTGMAGQPPPDPKKYFK
jgi:RNA polymerase sigma-70 factor (ECF subfamily)